MKKRSRGATSRRKPSAPVPVRRVSSRAADRSLLSVVGPDTYRVWRDMLATLVPHGRTHRLAPLIGGMLQCAAASAHKRFGSKPPDGSVAASLLDALESTDPDSAAAELGDLVERLFRDAKVGHARINARGDE